MCVGSTRRLRYWRRGQCDGLLHRQLAAVGAFGLQSRRAEFGDIGDDEISPLEFDVEPVEAGPPVDRIEPVAPPRALDRSFDDMT